MNQDWNTDGWGLLRRIIWLATVLAILITVLRLMAWADTDMRKLPAQEELTPYGVHGTL